MIDHNPEINPEINKEPKLNNSIPKVLKMLQNELDLIFKTLDSINDTFNRVIYFKEYEKEEDEKEKDAILDTNTLFGVIKKFNIDIKFINNGILKTIDSVEFWSNDYDKDTLLGEFDIKKDIDVDDLSSDRCHNIKQNLYNNAHNLSLYSSVLDRILKPYQKTESEEKKENETVTKSEAFEPQSDVAAYIYDIYDMVKQSNAYLYKIVTRSDL